VHGFAIGLEVVARWLLSRCTRRSKSRGCSQPRFLEGLRLYTTSTEKGARSEPLKAVVGYSTSQGHVAEVFPECPLLGLTSHCA
jgi:hypothetical protein